ncbi:MAG: phosphatidylserine decarboxylase [Deltaproteobacteria bacterium]|nr:phosphatidylserine decarboxylase [Deltaproteobacteria bacterium]
MMHQYVERDSGRVRTERLYGDRVLNMLFSSERENSSFMNRALSSRRISHMLGYINFDLGITSKMVRAEEFMASSGIDMGECFDDPESLNTLRKIFERKIRYWETRPMPEDDDAVVSPADAKVLLGSFSRGSNLFLKDKFFDFEELLGNESLGWSMYFEEGSYAVFRLTPEKYHYNHCPVTGIVMDIFEIEGDYYPCNPGVAVKVVTPHSKNKRVVTIIDTDVQGGSRVGLVAMVEIVALMIGDIQQCYSDQCYDDPKNVVVGIMMKRGQPKSLYRPGSSTDVLFFQKNRVKFDHDLVANMYLQNVKSRFSNGFGRPLVETEVMVRSRIAFRSR